MIWRSDRLLVKKEDEEMPWRITDDYYYNPYDYDLYDDYGTAFKIKLWMILQLFFYSE